MHGSVQEVSGLNGLLRVLIRFASMHELSEVSGQVSYPQETVKSAQHCTSVCRDAQMSVDRPHGRLRRTSLPMSRNVTFLADTRSQRHAFVDLGLYFVPSTEPPACPDGLMHLETNHLHQKFELKAQTKSSVSTCIYLHHGALLSAQWGCFTTIFRYEDDDRPDRTNIDDCIQIHVTDCVDITEDSGFGAHLAWARTFFRGGGLVLMNTPGSGCRWCWRSDIAGRNLQQIANHGLTFTAGRTTNVAVYTRNSTSPTLRPMS